jgi:poly(3-hydroxybutyrate) depolymerase
MLYQWHEYYRNILQPWSEMSGIIGDSLRNPSSQYALLPYAEKLSALFKLGYRLGKDYEKPSWKIQPLNIDDQIIPVIPEIVINKPFCHLLHFKRYSNHLDTLHKLQHQPKILLCAPLSGHHATLLKDTVCSFLKEYDVYITDWLDARTVPLDEGKFDLDDYVLYIQEFITHLNQDNVHFNDNPNLHVISVCQPTVPVMGAVSLMASRKEKLPATLTFMGGPIDARKSPTAVNSLAMQKSLEWFENHVIYAVPDNYIGVGRRVYPGFLQHAGFVAMNPDRHFNAHWEYYLDLVKGDKEDADSHVKFYDEYNAVLDMTAEYYLQTIEVVFQKFNLPHGTWYINDVLVKPQDIKNCAILTIEGELDDISGCGQTKAALDLCSSIDASDKQHITIAKAGHYGIFSGRRWRHNVFPQVQAFIHKYNK